MSSDAHNDILAVATRTKTGTTSSKQLRKAGKVPAMLAGHGSAPLAVSIDAKRFDEIMATGARHHLLHVTIDGNRKDTAIIRDVERDPLTRRILHADLQLVGASEAVNATLKIVTTGSPAGVKNVGGVLEIMVHELEVRGPADSIPESLTVDVSHLELHNALTAAQVPLPAGFTLVSEPDLVVATVTPPRTVVEVEAAEAPAEPALVSATESPGESGQ